MLIRTMSEANPLWGAPRIHGELLKLGIDVSQSTVAKYMPRRKGPPSPTWRTFVANHAPQISPKPRCDTPPEIPRSPAGARGRYRRARDGDQA